MVEPASVSGDIAVLMLVKGSGAIRGCYARELSKLRHVEGRTVYGVRWTVETHAVRPKGSLEPYGVFAAVRAHSEEDMLVWQAKILTALSNCRRKPKSDQSAPQPKVAYAAPVDETDGLEVEDFWRDGAIEPMGHNGLP